MLEASGWGRLATVLVVSGWGRLVAVLVVSEWGRLVGMGSCGAGGADTAAT